MQHRPPPIGFVLLGLAMAALGAVFTAGIFWSEEGWFVRLLVGGVAALSLLAAEALWFMRPWLARVIDAWALACPLALIAADLASEAQYDASSLGNVVTIVVRAILFVGMPCALVRGYVRGHAAVARLLPARRPLPRTVP